jgi:hypothetical protein
MSEIKILDKKTNASTLRNFAETWYPLFLKGAVDIENKKVAIGGEWHIQSSEVLVVEGGHKDNIWGFNILFAEKDEDNIYEYHSMVNIKPNKKHTKMEITDENLQQEILGILNEFIDLNK